MAKQVRTCEICNTDSISVTMYDIVLAAGDLVGGLELCDDCYEAWRADDLYPVPSTEDADVDA